MTSMPAPAPRWGAVTVPARDPERLAQSWAELLGTSVRGRREQYVFLSPLGDGPSLTFQRVTTSRRAAAERTWTCTSRTRPRATRWCSAPRRWAPRWSARSASPARRVLLEDPEGNPFCVVPLG